MGPYSSLEGFQGLPGDPVGVDANLSYRTCCRLPKVDIASQDLQVLFYDTGGQRAEHSRCRSVTASRDKRCVLAESRA